MAKVHFQPGVDIVIPKAAFVHSERSSQRENHEAIMKNSRIPKGKIKDGIENAIRSYKKNIVNIVDGQDVYPTELYGKLQEKMSLVPNYLGYWHGAYMGVQLVNHAIRECVLEKSIVFESTLAKYTTKK